MIIILTIKKKKKKKKKLYEKAAAGNYDSHLVFDLEELFHCHLFVLRDPPGSVDAAETATAAVLVEVDVIELDLHEGGAERRHLIMTPRGEKQPRRTSGRPGRKQTRRRRG